MLFSRVLLTALVPVGLLADDARRTAPVPELDLDALLAKHNLALVPRSDLTDALTELNALLRKNHQRDVRVPLYPRQNSTGPGSGSDSGSRPGSGTGSGSGSGSGPGPNAIIDLPGLGAICAC